MTKKRTDITIVGGGLIGLCLAPILGELGFKVILIDKEKIRLKKNIEKDSRTVAVSLGTKLFLEKYGIWKSIQPYSQPIEKIFVLNRNKNSNIHFSNEVAMGYIVKNKILKKKLIEKIDLCKNINILDNSVIKKITNNKNTISVFAEKNTCFESKLVVAADGKNSFLKKYYNIPSYDINYRQSAIVMNFNHSKNHNNTAYEIFLPNGPLATLPMKSDKAKLYKSSLIWTEKKSFVENIINLDHNYLKKIIEEKIHPYLGTINKFEEIKKFELTAHICRKFYSSRVALVGDSAHSIHPIAGQGWNLGIRDLKYLIAILKEYKEYGLDIGSMTALKDYNNNRFFDASNMLFITHGLNKIFGSKSKFVNTIRSAGFSYINKKSSINKSLVNYAMGINL